MTYKVQLFVPSAGPVSDASPSIPENVGSGILVEDDVAVFRGSIGIVGRKGPFVVKVDLSGGVDSHTVTEWIRANLEECYLVGGDFHGVFRMAKPTQFFSAPTPTQIGDYVGRTDSADGAPTDPADHDEAVPEAVAAASAAGPSGDVSKALAAGASRVLEVDPELERGGICRWVPWC